MSGFASFAAGTPGKHNLEFRFSILGRIHSHFRTGWSTIRPIMMNATRNATGGHCKKKSARSTNIFWVRFINILKHFEKYFVQNFILELKFLIDSIFERSYSVKFA